LRISLLAAGAFSLVAAGLAPKPPGPRILVAATVADNALDTMPAALWTQLVKDYAGRSALVFSGIPPATAADCRNAGADFMLAAAFGLRPRLPGMPNAGERVAAQAHLAFSNCITGLPISERFIDLTSDPVGKDDPPSVAWNDNVTEALKRYPLAVPAFHRITYVSAPIAYVDFTGGKMAPGVVLYDYARPDRTARAQPIVLTVVEAEERYVQAAFATIGNAEQPGIGDLVETAPTPQPVTAPPAPRP
jgi:hypothetical protein